MPIVKYEYPLSLYPILPPRGNPCEQLDAYPSKCFPPLL